MVRANLHNLVLVTILACLGFLVLKMLSKSGAANLPVIGPLLSVAAAA